MLENVFPVTNIIVNLESEDKDELFEEMLEVLVASHPEIDRSEALAALKERENKMSTGIIPGIAVPHAISKTVQGVVGAVGISKAGIDYDSLDGQPVRLVFMFLFAEGESGYHLKVMREISGLLQLPNFATDLLSKGSAQAVYDYILQAEEESARI